MIQTVIKRDGREEAFSLDKLEGLAKFCAKHDVHWSLLKSATLDKLQDRCTTEDILHAMIDACTDNGATGFLKCAARLTRGDMYRQVYKSSKPDAFSTTYERLVREGYWKDFNISVEDMHLLDVAFAPHKDKELEFASLCQFVDKYLMKDSNSIGTSVELAEASCFH